ALNLSEGKNLMYKVLYASEYAVLMHERKLFYTLLDEVVHASAAVKNLTLINVIAQRKAKQLLEKPPKMLDLEDDG
ncbi:MAG TPA: hypothetical protein EYO58_11235, partial [Flavobacteriales bacterium]|nr:hypothetical protein [Flavobacteriales bacterium]